jgi:hypothetical protein
MDRWCCRWASPRPCTHRPSRLLLHAPQEEQDPQPASRTRFRERTTTRRHSLPAEHLPHQPRLTTTSSILSKHAAERCCSSFWRYQARQLLPSRPTVACDIARFTKPIRCSPAVAATRWPASIWRAFSVDEPRASECAARTIQCRPEAFLK